MDTFVWFLGLSAVVFLVLGIPYLITWANMAFTRLRPIECRAIEDSELPDGLVIAAQRLREKLESMGFLYQGVVASRSICFDLKQESYSLVFLDAERRVMACLAETSYPGALRMFEVAFYSQLVNGTVLYTTDCHGHQMFRLPDAFVAQDGYFGDVERQWSLHCARVNCDSTAPDEWSADTYEASPQAIAVWLQQCYETFFTFWLEHKIILRPGGAVYYPNPLYLLRFTRDLIRKQRAAISQLKSALPFEPSTDQRFLLERQLAFQKGSNTVSKILLLAVSLIVFYFAFGLIFSWTFVPMLAVALFIHEYGHYLAMRYVGYRNTQIFFLPLLGAVTTGQKSDPTLWQELLVYLAGPIPGIVLGLGLFASPWAETWPWIQEFAIICFILNFINLLPLVPLDGGRVVEKLMFTRFAGARFGFYVLSAIGFAAAAWFTRDLVLAFLAIVTGILAKNEWHKRGILLRIRNRNADFFSLSADQKRDLILSGLCTENLNVNERFLFAKDLVANHSQSLPTLKAALLGLMLYTGLLSGGVAGAYYSFSHFDFVRGDDFSEEAYYSPAYWRDSVDEEQEFGGSGWHSVLGAVRALSSGPNPEDAKEFILQAEQRVKNLNEPDLRLAQWRLLKPDITGIPLVAEDVAFIRSNVLGGSGEPFERAYALISLLDTRSLLKDEEKISIIDEAFALLGLDTESDLDISAELYHRQGELQRILGRDSEAKRSFEKGFEHEVHSDYPFRDSNYTQLIDIYFAEGAFREALAISEIRLASVTDVETGFPKSMQTQFLHGIQQQRAWFLLLTDNETASDSFAELLKDYQGLEQTEVGYDKSHIELLLDTLHSHYVQGRDSTVYTKLVQQLPREHIEKFIRGCNCKTRGAFDTYRHGIYLEVLEQLGFSAAS
jgi:Zn-dependent protease